LRLSTASAGLLLLMNSAAVFGAPEGFRGLSLTQAIAKLEQRGLHVIYSTDLVKPWMRISAEPAAAAPAQVLDQILAPFALRVRSAPGDIYAVVRAEPPHAKRTTRSLLAPVAQELDPDPTALEEIVVAASQYQLTRDLGSFRNSLSSTDFESIPDLGDDALRPVARLPGTTSNGLTARTHLRGGEASETLVQLDGVRLYDPFHLRDFQGMFSAIDPRIVGKVDVYTGGLSAMYGDRMSGVIDITSLDAPAPRYGEVNVSFFNTSTLFASQFDDNRGQWVASLRRSNLDALYHAFSDLPGTPTYLDGFAKVSYELNDGLRLTAGTLYFLDDVSAQVDDGDEQAQSDSSNEYYWVRLDHHPGDTLSGTTVLAHSRVQNIRHGITDKSGVSRGSLDDWRVFNFDSLESNWSWRATDRALLQFGGEVRLTRGRYHYRDDVDFDVLLDAPGAPTVDTRHHDLDVLAEASPFALYGSARYGITSTLTADLGLRFESHQLEPRVGARWQIGERTTLRASWGRIYQSQGVDELQIADDGGAAFPPQRADQSSLGFEYRFSGGIELRAEVYAKRLTGIRPRYENLLDPLTLVPELKPDRIALTPRRGWARGLEVLLASSDSAPLRWWVSYSLSDAKERIDGVEEPRSWDQPFALSAGLDWSTTRWKASLALLQHSGWPGTTVSLDENSAAPRLLTGQRNATRMDLYRSVDGRLERRFEFDHSALTAFLEVSNLLGRSNPCCTAYEIDDETGALEQQQRHYLPRIPSLGFVWQF
jgi:hypothetical protein